MKTTRSICGETSRHTQYTSKGGFCRPGKKIVKVSGGGGGGSGGGGNKGGGSGSGGGNNGSGAGQSPYPLQAFCNSSISLRLESHFFRK